MAHAGGAHYRAALTLPEVFAMRPLVGHCHARLGRLYRSTGDPRTAEAHLATAAGTGCNAGRMA